MRFLSLAGWCPVLAIIIVFIAGDTHGRQLVSGLYLAAIRGSIE